MEAAPASAMPTATTGHLMRTATSETLADVAMIYYENDFHNTLGNDVTLEDDFDTADHQHMVTYSVSFGLYGTINPEDLSGLYGGMR